MIGPECGEGKPAAEKLAVGHQLGKLRAFAVGQGIDLRRWVICALVGVVGFTVIPRCSLLDLVRLWCGIGHGSFLWHFFQQLA
ncbi:hypothetical protein [Streptomyces sp. Wb2n-11]|uniref:hypothetical protein n=1 Tax=Streptomyces sp. Wb2n-11 TaxID=1030533 RepID=UPI0011477E60|nr:hypothetical protein [Streptomyces sp. Wb2n-11]